MCSLCRLPVAKNHNFGQILTFEGLLYRPPFTYEGQIWCATADPQSTFTCQNFSRSVYSIALWRQKKPNFVVFGLQHLEMSTVGGNLRKLNTVHNYKPSPYPTASKSFLYSNVFMVKSGAETLTFKSVTDRQKSSTLSDPHETWHGDRGPRARSCTLKTFGGLTHRLVLPLGALKIWG